MNHIRKSIFILRLEGKPGTGIRALRWLLKRLLRQHGLRCLDAHEESVPVRDPANEAEAISALSPPSTTPPPQPTTGDFTWLKNRK
jgi:hypothetical protein